MENKDLSPIDARRSMTRRNTLVMIERSPLIEKITKAPTMTKSEAEYA